MAKIKREPFKKIIIKIKKLLVKNKLHSEVDLMDELIYTLDNKKDDLFIQIIQSADVWGSGGFWDSTFVGDCDKKSKKEFKKLLVNLIDQMQEHDLVSTLGGAQRLEVIKEALSKDSKL